MGAGSGGFYAAQAAFQQAAQTAKGRGAPSDFSAALICFFAFAAIPAIWAGFQHTDPQRVAVLGAQLLSQLSDGSLTVVRLATVDEFCTDTGKTQECSGHGSAERPGNTRGRTCNLCEYVSDDLKALAEGSTLVASDRPYERLGSNLIRGHLSYNGNATVFEPSLDAVAARLPQDPGSTSHLLVLTDGMPDKDLEPTAQTWTTEKGLQLRYTSVLLVGLEARQPGIVPAQNVTRVAYAYDLLEAIADLYAVSHGSSAEVRDIDSGHVGFFVPEEISRVDVVLVAHGPLRFRAPPDMRTTGRGHNGHGLRYVVLRIDNPESGEREIEARGRNAFALILTHHDLEVVIDEVPPAVVAGQPFEVKAHVTRAGRPTLLPGGARVDLVVNDNRWRPRARVSSVPSAATQALAVADRLAGPDIIRRTDDRGPGTVDPRRRGVLHGQPQHVVGGSGDLVGALGVASRLALAAPGTPETGPSHGPLCGPRYQSARLDDLRFLCHPP
ncbi:hypothetical protein ACFL6C_01905 [Myxococcota bacterium]